jgi:eukaryotic-like serine/threonine-protein kinase
VRLTPGTRVGPYEVLTLLGSGGMAEVYRALDTRLGREVALKVASESLGAGSDLLARLEREARLESSLSHPNVVAVHDVGLHEGFPFFVTELLHGETLRHRLARGPIPLATALDWAAQMARTGVCPRAGHLLTPSPSAGRDNSYRLLQTTLRRVT